MKAILMLPELRPVEKLVLLKIAERANNDGAGAWPSLDTLARAGSCDRRRVRRVVGDLAARGWLTVQPGGHGRGSTNTYALVVSKVFLRGAPAPPFQPEPDPKRGARAPRVGGRGRPPQEGAGAPGRGAPAPPDLPSYLPSDLPIDLKGRARTSGYDDQEGTSSTPVVGRAQPLPMTNGTAEEQQVRDVIWMILLRLDQRRLRISNDDLRVAVKCKCAARTPPLAVDVSVIDRAIEHVRAARDQQLANHG